MDSQRERNSSLACWPRRMPGTGAVAGGAQDGGRTPCDTGAPAAECLHGLSPQAGDTDAAHGMVSHLCANGDIDPRASAACILALAQPMRRYQVSGAQLQGAVGSQGGERSRRDAHTPVWARRGKGAGTAVISLARSRSGQGPYTRACMRARRQDDHSATQRPVSDDEP